ncbi:hypothetical protein L1987_63645 [Smallanthus sonchifolius]|uniref:Uncharacterized protein n=1 Tax=Smallanthus sonchifolius TaxID=185202 RepID=A0ACB9CE21_9ASTR|nr:hypothetical protein L1987_63645 [Smallanthus sonchifolius]
MTRSASSIMNETIEDFTDQGILDHSDLELSPKFCELVPAKSDTDKRIETLLEIPVGERSFRFESTISQAILETQYSESEMSSGIPKSSSQFALSDLDNLLSGVVLDLEIFEWMDSDETTKKLQGLMNLGLEKLYANLSEAEKSVEEAIEKVEEAIEKVEDLKKILVAKSKYLENEIQNQKNKLQESITQYELKLLQTVDDAKKSAAKPILQSRIQMAEQAAAEGFDRAAWDAGAGDAEKQVDQGDEGYLNLGEMANLYLLSGSLEVIPTKQESLVKVGVSLANTPPTLKTSPSIVFNQYAPLPASESIKYGPSHFGASFPSLGLVVFWNAFLSTKSPTWNLLILILLLYDLAIPCW